MYTIIYNHGKLSILLAFPFKCKTLNFTIRNDEFAKKSLLLMLAVINLLIETYQVSCSTSGRHCAQTLKNKK